MAETDAESDANSMPPRYHSAEVDVGDTNVTGQRIAPLQIGRLNLRIMLALIAPNILPPIAFVAVLDVARMMIFEAILGFIALTDAAPDRTEIYVEKLDKWIEVRSLRCPLQGVVDRVGKLLKRERLGEHVGADNAVRREENA